MQKLVAAALVSLTLASPARTQTMDELCAPFDIAIEIAEQGLAGLSPSLFSRPDEKDPTCNSAEILSGGSSYSCEWAFPKEALGAAQVKASVIIQCLAERNPYASVEAGRDELAWQLSDTLTAVLRIPERRETKLVVGLRFIANR